METIDVESRVISITDWRDEKPKSTKPQALFHYGFVVPMALIGLVVSMLWLAGTLGIGHFMLYYGPSVFRAAAAVC